MPRVKQPILAVAFILAAAGCTQLELARFAPPGIIKYEDLAGDQPQNPAIQERIAERKTEADARYPILSETPGESDRPELPPEAERNAQLEALSAQRDALEIAVNADRAAADAEKSEAALLPVQRDALKEQTDRDAAAVEREQNRQAPLEPLDTTPPD